jgi:hypothetical protein
MMLFENIAFSLCGCVVLGVEEHHGERRETRNDYDRTEGETSLLL